MFFLSVLLFTHFADAYTVILKNGRRCDGSLITDAGGTLQLRDFATGVILSFKKDQLDMAATTAANSNKPVALPDTTVPSDPQAERRVSDVADELRARRTGQARVYTMADLDSAPQVSIAGNGETERVTSDSADPGDENGWRRQARVLRKELEAAEDRAATSAADCEKARGKSQSSIASPHEKPQDLRSLMREPSECVRAASSLARLEAARDRFAAFEERARRAGVPHTWLE
jgi:hypothetical protein